jgi:alpha-ketoglutaric semialdehyde dehydrogenase
MDQQYHNFIAGEWTPSREGRTFEDRNPADRDEVVGVFPLSDQSDVDAAVQAAKAAFEGWSSLPVPKRGEIIWRAGRLLEERKEEVARLATQEMGKILLETRGDVQEGIDTAYYMGGEGRRLFGQTTPSELPSKFAMSVRRPVGVAGIITPWNFPMAIPTWKIFPALLCGNTVVFKPASDAPRTALALVEILAEAGLPPGVVNLVFGSGGEAGMAVARHKDVRLVSFTGSTDTGRTLSEALGRDLKRLSLELGGKNGQIVMDDADLELALEGALWGAFGTTGQRCTATSRTIVHRAVLGEFTEELVRRADDLRLGPGLEEETEMGPLVNDAAREKVERYVDIGREEDGARLLTGGEPATGGALDRGAFFRPTIFDEVTPAMRIAQEEIFGPVLAVMPVDSFEEAIAVLNATRYGLSSSIYTRDVDRAFRAIEKIDAGITYVNGPTIGAEVHLPFGGTKDTGNGHRESGTQVLDFYSEWKSVYVDYSGRLQRAQIDTLETLG